MQQRADLSDQQVQQASAQICDKLKTLEPIKQAKTIGFYWPVRGEIDVRPFIAEAWQQQQKTYLPVLDNDQERVMHFYAYDEQTQLTENHFGIPEPDPKTATTIAAAQLDVVIVPVLAFDQNNNRLGCGCGYYDSTFAFKKQQPAAKPYLIGVAYAWQQQEFEVQDWDVAMDCVVSGG